MKITHITLHHLHMPLVSHFETSFGRIYHRESILVKVRAGDLVGYGECTADRDPGYSYETATTAWPILRDYLAPTLLGQPFPSPQAYQQRVASVRGHQMAKAGLEMALWDLKGKRENRSLREMIGGVREAVDVGVSVGLQDSPDALVQTVAAYLEDGYRRIKIKIKPGRDVSEVQAIRAQYPDLKLQVDANSAYALETANPQQHADALLPLDDFNLLLIEQPLAEDDLWDHSKLQKKFTTPLCLDESITGPRQARQALEMDACRVVNIKQPRVGGLTNAIAIHDLCQARGIPVWCGGMLETGVGRATNLALASLPNFQLPGDISATERYYHQDVTEQVFCLNPDSTITVPDGPGLGVTIHRKALAQHTQATLPLTPE